MPVPTPSGVSVISIGMLKPRRDQVVAWRGPMLDRALVQMLADVYWGDLDVLLLDLPPGTGDVAISIGQHLPNAEVVVVTTPQEAAAEVAERAGTMASMMHQRVVGVVENMSFLPCPHCAAGRTTGSRCSAPVVASGSRRRSLAGSGTTCRCSARCPLDMLAARGRRRRHADRGSNPTSAGRRRARSIADALAGRDRGLAGMQLGLTPAGRSEPVFGVGLPELAVIMLVAVLVFGPERLPELARQAGQLLRQVRSVRRMARDELRQELGPEYADLELTDLDPRTIVRKHIIEAMEEPTRTPRRRGSGLRLRSGELRRTTRGDLRGPSRLETAARRSKGTSTSRPSPTVTSTKSRPTRRITAS